MQYSTLLFHLLLFLSFIYGNADESDEVKQSLIDFLLQLSANNTQLVHDMGWDASTDPCDGSWKSVECNNKTKSVQSIKLQGFEFAGSIDAGRLCRAPSLAVIRLQDNSIHGALPPDISNCTSLTHLYLGSNRLTGLLPASLASLGNLKLLDISNNNFSSELPELAKISGLSALLVQNNRLNGSIPSLWFTNFGAGYFNVSYNRLTGPIPQGGDRFGASSFVGNLGLCGAPLPNACPPSPALPALSSSLENGKSANKLEKMAVMLSGYIAFALVLLLFICYYIFFRKKRTEERDVGPDMDAAYTSPKSSVTAANKTGTSRSEYSIPTSIETAAAMSSSLIVLNKTGTSKAMVDLKFEDLLKAPAEMIGRGRFGSTYKVMLVDGAALAVKRIKDCGISAAEFRRRMVRVDMARHRNVLPAVAFYCSAQEKLVVYDYQHNGSLFNLLQGSQVGGTFDWSSRLRVAKEIADGLVFMHKALQAEGIIGHGNLKSSNILFNGNMHPCISEYGLVDSANLNENNAAGKARTNITGAVDKADVYAFGIILLELLTGKLVQNDPLELARWVNSVVREEWTVEVFDKNLFSDGASEERMVQTLQVGLKCIDPSPDSRPSMDHVAALINSIREEEEDKSLISEAQY